MAFLMPGEGAVSTLSFLKSSLINLQWTMSLYTNDPTIDYGLVFDQFQPASFIAPIPFIGVQFGLPVNEDGKAVMTSTDIDFVQFLDFEQTIYGWYVYDADMKVCMVERFPKKIEISKAGEQVRVSGVRILLHS